MRRRLTPLSVLLLSACFTVSLHAQTAVRALTEAEVQQFLPLAHVQLQLLTGSGAELAASHERFSGALELVNDVRSGKVDARTWLSARPGMPQPPSGAVYEAACSRSNGAQPVDLHEDAYRSDLASPMAVFSLPWKGTPVRRPDVASAMAGRPNAAAHAAYTTLKQQKAALAAQYRAKGWYTTEGLGTHYLVSPDTAWVITLSDDLPISPACAAIGNGKVTGPIFTVQALEPHRADPRERWDALLEKSGWDEQRYNETFFQLRLVRQFVLDTEEAKIWRQGGVVPPQSNLALYRRHAAELDAILERHERLRS